MAEPPSTGQAAAVQQYLVDALARRAVAQPGAVRALIEARAALLQQGLASAQTGRAADRARRPPAPGPLADLAGRLGAAPAGAGEPADLKTVQYFRSTWTRLGDQRRMAQTQAALPDNAGPLNSQRLVHRALVLMRETSPAYLQHFMAHVDALVALDQAAASGDAAPAAKAKGRAAAAPQAAPKTARKTARRRNNASR